MSKRERHSQILDVLKHNRVGSQEALRELLAGRGTDVTQATLSRDVRELRLVKIPGTNGTAHYSIPEEWETTPPLESLLPTLYQGAEGVDHLLVVRTMRGGAVPVAVGIDWEEWPEVMGTVAGDNTILIVVREKEALSVIRDRIERMAAGPGG